ncbi:hypothetical protein AVEN_218285-1 [Araneus ventricosus]|uniref:Uncharacterized protein n=1 Tax=Araneus ventricosus TaxID=182803 RepID=A0A4Y2IR26_ARAVE|nr:hypothetical protein AVEN_218285-1 [Araneus ventricosus]
MKLLYRVSQNSTYKLGEEVENIVRNHNDIEKHGRKCHPQVIERLKDTQRAQYRKQCKTLYYPQKEYNNNYQNHRRWLKFLPLMYVWHLRSLDRRIFSKISGNLLIVTVTMVIRATRYMSEYTGVLFTIAFKQPEKKIKRR